MKYFIFVILAFTASIATANTVEKSTFPIAKPKIVGGEIATEDAWPWMSALIFTSNAVVTSLDVAGTSYDSAPFSYSPAGKATATMANCGKGDSQCDAAAGKICLIARGEIDFSVKVDNCQSGGGIGAIIFNNTAGSIDGTLGESFTGSIPVVEVSQDDGAILLGKLDSTATIQIDAQATQFQSASCGASFIGDKWVLTAAHCVENTNTNALKVSIGEYDLSNGASNPKAVKQIYIHPEYNEGADFNNDIALIELVETIDHPAVKLVDLNTSKQLAFFNNLATVIGWGNRTAYGPEDESPANSQPDKLHQVVLSLLSNQECKSALAKAYSDLQDANIAEHQVGITDGMICAQYTGGGKGSCQGDSGGPLLVNTNDGWQQIGIVSYGIGCADAAFPDVYARVGQFTDWINTITQGIAIEPSYDFAITAQNTAQTKELTVTNNSDLTANLTFTLQAEDIVSTGFSLTTDNCTSLAAQQSCQLKINFDAKTLGQHKAKIVIGNSNTDVPTSQSDISAQAIAANSQINTQLSGGSSELLWFSGGDEPWIINTSEAAIMSGNIDDGQQSSAMLTFTGAGTLSFQWKVSSEENTDNPEVPYDALYLIIDGEQVKFISGKVEYTKVTIPDLAEGKHQITWLYQKDNLTSKDEDRGYLKDVSFTPITPAVPVEPTPVVPAAPDVATPEVEAPVQSESSGGSMSIGILILAFIGIRRRRTH